MSKKKLIIENDPGDGNPVKYEARTTKDKTNDHQMHIRYWKGDDGWTDKVRGKKGIELFDDGNGIALFFADPDVHPIRLNYSQAALLHVMLNYYECDNGTFRTKLRKYKEIK